MTMMMMYRVRDGDQSAASIPRLTVQQLKANSRYSKPLNVT